MSEDLIYIPLTLEIEHNFEWHRTYVTMNGQDLFSMPGIPNRGAVISEFARRLSELLDPS